MKHATMFFSIVCLSLGLGVTGCGKGGSSCDQLAKKVCAGQDATKCKAWLDSEMTGPDGKHLSKTEAEAGCKMILDDSKALDAYTKQAAEHSK